MPITTQWRSITYRNPIYPFAWEAVYRCGSHITQFPRGHLPWLALYDRQAVSAMKATHPVQYDIFMRGEMVYTCLLDCTRLEKLLIHGHTYSPLELPAPYPTQALDEVIAKRSVDMHVPLSGSSSLSYTIRWFFGYRYGRTLALLEIDQYGNLYKTNTDRGQGTGAEDVILRGGALL